MQNGAGVLLNELPLTGWRRVSPLCQSSSHQTRRSHFKLKLTAQTSQLEPSFRKSWQTTENDTQSPSYRSHYLQSNAITRSTTKRCSLLFKPYNSGGTSLKAPNTSSRYGQTTKTLSTSWQQNSSIEDKPGGHSTSRSSTSSFITDQGNPWASQMCCLKGLTVRGMNAWKPIW